MNSAVGLSGLAAVKLLEKRHEGANILNRRLSGESEIFFHASRGLCCGRRRRGSFLGSLFAGLAGGSGNRSDNSGCKQARNNSRQPPFFHFSCRPPCFSVSDGAYTCYSHQGATGITILPRFGPPLAW